MPARVDAAVLGPGVLRRVEDVDGAAGDADVLVGVVEDAAERRQAQQGAALGVGAAVAAADVEDPAVAGDREAVRLAAGGEAGGRRAGADQLRGPVVGVDRRLAVTADEAGGPLEGAEQVLLEVGLGVADSDAAHAGVEGAAAAVVAAPRDRLVGTADGGAVAGRRADGAGSGRRCGPDPSGASSHVYQRSLRLHWSGRSRVEGCTRSPGDDRLRDAVVGVLFGRAPIRPLTKLEPGSTVAVEPMPRKPLPPSTKAWSAASPAESSTSPATLTKTSDW